MLSGKNISTFRDKLLDDKIHGQIIIIYLFLLKIHSFLFFSFLFMLNHKSILVCVWYDGGRKSCSETAV